MGSIMLWCCCCCNELDIGFGVIRLGSIGTDVGFFGFDDGFDDGIIDFVGFELGLMDGLVVGGPGTHTAYPWYGFS
jgi:hypothetical protein